MAHIYRRKNSSLYYSHKTKQHNFPSVKLNLDIEDKFHASLKACIRGRKQALHKVLSDIDISFALYEGPLTEGMCVRDLNIMGFGCPISSFNDPLLQIANHIHASCWEPQDDQDGHTIIYELKTYLMQVLILQECGKALHRFKQSDGCVVINPYEERFKHAITHFKSWFDYADRKLFYFLFSTEEYLVILHAYISHRRKTLFDLNYKFPKRTCTSFTYFTPILLWHGCDMEERDIEWMKMTRECRWGGYIEEKFYADTIKDGLYCCPQKMQKNYRVGLKQECVVVNVLPNEKDLVWWQLNGKKGTPPCPNCRAYSKSLGWDMEFMSSKRGHRCFSPYPQIN